jgi:serine/threonine protein kinase
VGDFGLARILDPGEHQLLTRSCGTIGYMPLERIQDNLFTKAADVYSFGVLCWEMLSGQRAWAGRQPVQILYARTALKLRLELPADVPGCPSKFRVGTAVCCCTACMCTAVYRLSPACPALPPLVLLFHRPSFLWLLLELLMLTSPFRHHGPYMLTSCLLLSACCAPQELVQACLSDEHTQRPSFCAICEMLSALLMAP